MIIRLLGSGSADGIPAFFSDDRVSEYARQHGGKDVRTRSGALVDGHIKIDLAPDTLMQLQRDGLKASDWTGLFFTHSHDDHFSYPELQYGFFPFCDSEYLSFPIYANSFICDEIARYYPDWPLELVPTRSYVPVRHAGYTVTPIKAKHLDDEDSHNLLFEDGESTCLYATDTGWWPEATWAFLAGRKLDLLMLECTEGFCPTSYDGHLDAETFLKVVERMLALEALRPDSTVITTHHSHNGNATHAELEEFFVPKGIQVGFDGMEIEI